MRELTKPVLCVTNDLESKSSYADARKWKPHALGATSKTHRRISIFMTQRRCVLLLGKNFTFEPQQTREHAAYSSGRPASGGERVALRLWYCSSANFQLLSLRSAKYCGGWSRYGTSQLTFNGWLRRFRAGSRLRYFTEIYHSWSSFCTVLQAFTFVRETYKPHSRE